MLLSLQIHLEYIYIIYIVRIVNLVKLVNLAKLVLSLMFMVPVHRDLKSTIVQQDATIYSLLCFCKTAVHVSGGTSTHHQEHM